MTKNTFDLTDDQLRILLTKHDNMGKNSHVGHVAIEIVKLFFSSKDPNAVFQTGKNGADLEVCYLNARECFEVKGTVDTSISWPKLKVSSQACYDSLTKGMTLIRVTGVGSTKPILYFMKYGEDFELKYEARWAVLPKR